MILDRVANLSGLNMKEWDGEFIADNAEWSLSQGVLGS